MTIDELLRMAVERKASDLHLKVGNHPYLRVDGHLAAMTEQPRISPEDMLSMAFSIMTNRQKQKFKETAELDMAYGVAGLGRFRVNIFQQRGNVGMVLRVIPTKIKAIEELFLPKVIEQICQEQRGLVLVTGTTGSGKSTTLAAMIDRINSSRSDHIITIEDPIEFLHRDKKGFVNQREVEVDTASFGAALRAALRQDPDVILVGEMRDLETISLALTAAETGHLVFGTLHTASAPKTVDRIVDVFPAAQQEQIRIMFSESIQAVVTQTLLKKRGGGRIAAVEILMGTPAVRNLIREGKVHQIPSAMQTGQKAGMQTLDMALLDLVRRNLVTAEEAQARTLTPELFASHAVDFPSTAGLAGGARLSKARP